MKQLFEQAVASRWAYGPATPQETSASLHVGFGVDDRFVKGMGVLMLSLLARNPDAHFVFHVFFGHVSDANLARLETIARDHGCQIRMYPLRPDAFASLITPGRYTHAIFYRLLLAHAVAGETERVLYLDSDMICVGDLRPVFALDLQGKVAGVVGVAERPVALQHDFYFNSGMILMDVARWVAEQVSERTLAVLAAPPHALRFPDQDALNIVLDGQVLALDTKWNCLQDLGSAPQPVQDDAVILHFAGEHKAWSAWCDHPLQAAYLAQAAVSPWQDSPLDVPASVRDIRHYVRFLKRKGRTLPALRWYLKYLRASLARRLAAR